MLYIAKLHPNQNACVTWLKKIAVHPPKCDVAFHQSSIIGLHTQHATALAIPTSTSLASPWKHIMPLVWDLQDKGNGDGEGICRKKMRRGCTILFGRLVAAADLLWEKNTVSWVACAGLVRGRTRQRLLDRPSSCVAYVCNFFNRTVAYICAHTPDIYPCE